MAAPPHPKTPKPPWVAGFWLPRLEGIFGGGLSKALVGIGARVHAKVGGEGFGGFRVPGTQRLHRALILHGALNPNSKTQTSVWLRRVL